jgi:peptidoglycan/xylan/chitin deacetylase (PgdA/CDA1 family)
VSPIGTCEFTASATISWRRRLPARLRHAYRYVRTDLLWLRLLLTNARGVVVIQYHSVPDPDAARFTAPGNRMDRDLFGRQMEFIAHHRRAIGIDTLLQVIDGKQEAEQGSVLLVFDDGYRDNGGYVAALLDSLQLPAVFYLPTRMITRGDVPWLDVLYSAFRYRTRSHLSLPGVAGPFNLDDPDQSRAVYQSLDAKLIQADLPTRVSLLDYVVDALAPSESPPRLLMSWDEVRETKRQHPSIGFGVHGAEHLDLTSQSTEVLDADLDACKEDFRREIGEPPQHFAYPYNRSNPTSRGSLRERGFRSALTSESSILIDTRVDVLQIPRLDAPTDLRLLSRWTLGAFYVRRSGRRR